MIKKFIGKGMIKRSGRRWRKKRSLIKKVLNMKILEGLVRNLNEK
jgi:hypothetical protein